MITISKEVPEDPSLQKPVVERKKVLQIVDDEKLQWCATDPLLTKLVLLSPIDFVINLIDTNYDVGPSVSSYNNTNGIYPQSDSTWIIWIFIFSGGVVFSGMIIRFRYQNRRSKKQILKERRRKQQKRKRGVKVEHGLNNRSNESLQEFPRG